MKKVLLVVLILGLPALMLASNMGFKAQINHPAGGANAWWVSFPYFYDPNGDGTITSAEVCSDSTGLAALTMWNATTGKTQGYGCGGFDTPFTISKGLSYRFGGDGATQIQWTAVGSHDPSFGHSYPSGGANAWWISIPYHWNPAGGTKNSTALCTEATGTAAVTKWDALTGKTQGFGCGGFDTPFTIDVFDGYRLGGDGSTPITWTPSHY